MFRYAKYRSFLKIDLICYFFNSLVTAHKYRQTRSHTDNFGENNVKCLIAKGICRFVPHSSAGGF